MKRKAIDVLLIIGLILLVVGERSTAYVVSGRHWASAPTWYINPLNNSGFTLTQIRAALEPAMDNWCAGGQTTASCDAVYGGTTSGRTAANNGKNEVFFSPTTSGTSVGSATYYYNISTLELIDVDVRFYDTKYKFYTQTGCVKGIYLEDTAAHEFGHFYGMSHSATTAATMYSKTSYCNRNGISLHSDDVAGIEFLYEPTGSPPPVNTAPTVTISSPADASSHLTTDLISFIATATDTQDGTITSNLRWSSSLVGQIGTGASFSLVLPVGVHVITASVTDSGGLNGVDTHTISVSTVASGATLTTRPWKNGAGEQKVDLTWVNLPVSSSVSVYRDGVNIKQTANDGAFTDAINAIGSGRTYIYKVCVFGSTTSCTNEAAAVF
jgi:hypothetical protein